MASVSRIELLPSTALTATATGDSKVLEIGSANFVGWLKATGVNGATTIAAKIQHSANGTDWVDLVAFTNLVGVAGFEVKQITDNVLLYVRTVVTLSGGTQAATVLVSLYHDKSR